MRENTEKAIRKRIGQALHSSFNKGLCEGVKTMAATVLKDILEGKSLEEIKEKCEREIQRKP